MFKKLLATFSALGSATLLTASVVSCGPSFESLMARTVDTETFYGAYRAYPSNWSSATSNVGGDSDFFMNVIDNVLQYDEYNVIVGDLADGWEMASDQMSWKIHFNDKAEWFDHEGNRIKNGEDKNGDPVYYKIKAHHIANTMRNIFNPSRLSKTNGLWSDLLIGGVEIEKAIEKVTDEENAWRKENNPNPSDIQLRDFELQRRIDYEISKFIKGDLPNTDAWRPAWIAEREAAQKNPSSDQKYMIEIDDEKNEVIFNMKARAPYFGSVLTYSAFAPIPDEAIDILGVNPLINASTYGKSYKTIFNSGAYYVSNFNPLTNISFKANPNYRDIEKVYIKNLVFSYSSKKSVSASRLEWEVGDISDTAISPRDEAGWNKYVGKNNLNPTFSGIHMYETPIRFTFAYQYNFARVNADNPVPELNPINQAFAQRSTRALISYALNREYFLSYYTSNISKFPGSDASPFTVNRFIPKNLLTFSENEGRGLDNSKNVEAAKQQGIESKPENPAVKEFVKDYTDLVNDQYLLKLAKPAADELNPGKEFDAAAEIKKLDLGYEAHLHNDYVAYNGLTSDSLKNEFKQAKTYEEKIQILIKQVNEDFQSYKNNGAAPIPFDSNNKAGLRFLIASGTETTWQPFIREMASQFNIIENNPISIDIKVAANLEEQRSLTNSGDFSILMGGWGPDYADPATFLNTMKYNGDLSDYNNASKVINRESDDTGVDFYKGKNVYFDELANYFADYTKNIEAISEEIGYERFNKYAEQEINLIYKYMLFYPAFIDTDVKQLLLTYRNPFTNQTTEIGTTKAKYVGQKMVPRLWTVQEYIDAKKAYEDGRDKSIIYNWYEDSKNTKID